MSTFCYTRPKPDDSGVLCTIYNVMRDGKGLCRPPCAWRCAAALPPWPCGRSPAKQVAAGRLHHHFTSIGELKAQGFHPPDPRDISTCRCWWLRTPAGAALVLDDRQRGWPTGTLYPPVARGQVLADSDPDIKAAYLLTMNMWHAETVAIDQGLASGNSTKPSNT